jgi:hypothetical protein
MKGRRVGSYDGEGDGRRIHIVVEAYLVVRNDERGAIDSNVDREFELRKTSNSGVESVFKLSTGVVVNCYSDWDL